MTTPTDFIDEIFKDNWTQDRMAETMSYAQAKAALHKGIEALVLEVLGEDITLEPESVWYAKTKAHGGSHKEYWRLKAIINNENNLRAEQRKRLAALLKKKEGKV